MHNGVKNSQSCLTIAQHLSHNWKKRIQKEFVHMRHNPDYESHLQMYIVMRIHNLNRNKKNHWVACYFWNSHHFWTSAAMFSNIYRFRCENNFKLTICPSSMQKGIFTAGASNNLDHNPSSTTAYGFVPWNQY